MAEILYLADATVGDIQMDAGAALCLTLKSGRKFLLTVPPSANEDTEFQCWRSAFGYAVSKAKSLEVNPLRNFTPVITSLIERWLKYMVHEERRRRSRESQLEEADVVAARKFLVLLRRSTGTLEVLYTTIYLSNNIIF